MAKGWFGNKEAHSAAAKKGWTLRKGGKELDRLKVRTSGDYAREQTWLSSAAKEAYQLRTLKFQRQLARSRDQEQQLFERLRALESRKQTRQVRQSIASVNRRIGRLRGMAV